MKRQKASYPSRWIAGIAVSVCVMATSAHADEPLFGYTFSTDLLPKGQWEAEQWLTWRGGKGVGTFNAVEASSEIQYGWTDAVQIAAYVNYGWLEAHDNNVRTGTTFLPGAFASTAIAPHDRFRGSKFTGISGEIIYRFLSPYLDPIGAALYAKPTIGPGLRELTTRLILQKNYLDDLLVLAGNLIVGQQARFLRGNPFAPSGSAMASDNWNEASSVAIAFGVSYRFIANWSAAIEVLNEREWSGLVPVSASRRTNSAYYLGPSLHYADQNLFATLTLLAQLPWAQDYANGEPDFVANGKNYSANHEDFRLRLKFGYYVGEQS